MAGLHGHSLGVLIVMQICCTCIERLVTSLLVSSNKGQIASTNKHQRQSLILVQHLAKSIVNTPSFLHFAALAILPESVVNP